MSEPIRRSKFPEPISTPQAQKPAIGSPGALPATAHYDKPNPTLASQQRDRLREHAMAGSTLKEVLTLCKQTGTSACFGATFGMKSTKEDQALLGLLAALAMAIAVAKKFPL